MCSAVGSGKGWGEGSGALLGSLLEPLEELSAGCPLWPPTRRELKKKLTEQFV